jgi:hypothetical protein
MAAKLKVVQDGFDLPPLGVEDGSSFGWFDRLIFGWKDGMVFDYGDWEARDIYEMMDKDYKARQLENALSLPIVSAERNIVPAKGDKGEHDWLVDFWDHDHLNGGCKNDLDHIINQMTSGITYKRAYFEKVWVPGTGDFDGKIVYDKIAFRPQTTCRIMRDAKNGDLKGFEQEAYYVGPEITNGVFPIQIPRKRSFVYVHGTRRDPLNGTSDMEIAYWCWKTKQKILLLWFQFLQAVSLPRTLVKAGDIGVAQQVAGQIAKLKSSGIIPLAAPQGPDSVDIQTLDVSGKGAEQFMQAINWLDNAATNAVLAGFLNLTDQSGGKGTTGTSSLALSKDASDFFLQMEEAKVREMEYQIRAEIFAPLIRYNFGRQAAVPKIKFEPLHSEDKSMSVELFQAMVTARSLTMPGAQSLIPDSFVALLAEQVSGYIGLDGKKVQADFEEAARKAKAQAAMTPAGASPVGQQAAGMFGATQAASRTVATRTAPSDLKKIQKAAAKAALKSGSKKPATQG